MFRHAQTSERKGGIRWRLDMLALQKYLTAKGYNAKAQERKMYEKMRDLKWQQLKTTIEVLEEIEPDSIDECYESVAMIWS